MEPDHSLEPELWYNNPGIPPPFEFQVTIQSNGSKKTNKAIACFPWKLDDIGKLFNGEFVSVAMPSQWREVVDKWSGVCAIGGEGQVRVIKTSPQQPFLPMLRIRTDPEAIVRCVAWSIVTNEDSGFWPLVSFAAGATLYVFNVEKGEYYGVMRGHGNNINAIAVHPTDPSIILSASSDHTCRIYDLRETVECLIENPRWPKALEQASMAGPAFGMRVYDGEGFGRGRCFAVLRGGPFGGHQAPVLGAAFHKNYPIIATCGMDHAIKLWRIPGYHEHMINLEEKPIFNTINIHSAQVLSISWLNDDTLISHSGPIILREEDATPKFVYKRPGTVAVWRWLCLERFFPKNRTHYPPIIKGSASDHHGSSSFKILSHYKLPHPVQPLQSHVFTSTQLAPLFLLPSRGVILASSIKGFEQQRRKPFPNTEVITKPSRSVEEDELATRFNKLRIRPCPGDSNIVCSLTCWSVGVNENSRRALKEWNISQEAKLPKLEACVMGEEGNVLIGVGEKEGIWIWRIPKEKQYLCSAPPT